MQENNLVTVDEMANILRVPKSWLYSRTRETGSGSIPRIKVGKYLRFEPQKVIHWIKRQNEGNE